MLKRTKSFTSNERNGTLACATFVLSALAAVVTAPAEAASAFASIAGSACNTAKPGDQLYRGYNWIANQDAANSAYAVCPVPRKSMSAAGADLTVSLNLVANTTVLCTAFSVTPNGGTLASQTATVSGTGWKSLPFHLGSSSASSSYVVSCNLPPNKAAYLYGVALTEL